MWDQSLTFLLQGTLEDHIHRQHIPGAVVAVIRQNHNEYGSDRLSSTP